MPTPDGAVAGRNTCSLATLGRSRSFDIVDIDLHKPFAAVFDRADANDRTERDDCSPHHRLLEILFVVFWAGSVLLLEQLDLHIRPRFEPFEAFADIGEEARF